SGHRFRTQSDTEVIVHLYEEMGPACVERLRGMFAFALWDRHARRLVLARVPAGKKPLFCSLRDGWLWLASQPRAMPACGETPLGVDYHGIDQYLHYQVVPNPRSGFAAIRKLPPAHVLTWSDGAISTHRYWKLSYRDRDLDLTEAEVC